MSRETAAAPPALLEDLFVAPPADPAAPPRASRLSERELRVVVELARGASTEGIARVLGVSPHTVRTHVRNLMGKLGAETRAHAVAICLLEAAVERGLAGPQRAP
ncbi:MAG: helix-turn-helix transcriptional regulator [Actinomycetota bacterium]|nr:helix-turn-helix transcriptional regulator [Actinomycetota bacterium]